MKRPIASDFDGTFDSHPEIWSQTDVIITGNYWGKYEDVMSRWPGPKKPIYFCPIDPDEDMMKVVAHKADVINKLKARKFYEDQSEQATVLKIMCPECEIILVKEGATFI